MTTDQKCLVKSWFVGTVTVVLTLVYLNEGIFPFIILFVGGTITKTIRKGFDPEVDRWIPKLSGGWQLFVAGYYLLLAFGAILLVAKNPKAISYESRWQFVVFVLAILGPLFIVLMRREINMFIGSESNKT